MGVWEWMCLRCWGRSRSTTREACSDNPLRALAPSPCMPALGSSDPPARRSRFRSADLCCSSSGPHPTDRANPERARSTHDTEMIEIRKPAAAATCPASSAAIARPPWTRRASSRLARFQIRWLPAAPSPKRRVCGERARVPRSSPRRSWERTTQTVGRAARMDPNEYIRKEEDHKQRKPPRTENYVCDRFFRVTE